MTALALAALFADWLCIAVAMAAMLGGGIQVRRPSAASVPVIAAAVTPLSAAAPSGGAT